MNVELEVDVVLHEEAQLVDENAILGTGIVGQPSLDVGIALAGLVHALGENDPGLFDHVDLDAVALAFHCKLSDPIVDPGQVLFSVNIFD